MQFDSGKLCLEIDIYNITRIRIYIRNIVREAKILLNTSYVVENVISSIFFFR